MLRGLTVAVVALALAGGAVAQPAPNAQRCPAHKQAHRPPDATAICRDGSYSTSKTASACSKHCGVLRWIKRSHHA